MWGIAGTRPGKAHCWYDPKNTSSPSIRVSYCGKISRQERLLWQEVDRCRICTKRLPTKEQSSEEHQK